MRITHKLGVLKLMVLGTCVAFGAPAASAGDMAAIGQSQDTARREIKSAPSYHLDFQYGQSSDLWSTYYNLSGAQGNLPQIESILSIKYGSFEQGNSSVHAQVDGIALAPATDLFRTMYFSAGAEASAFGLVQNPVIPVLHADIIAAGSLSAGAEGRIASWGAKTRFGITGGMGHEKRVDASSTDLIEHFPVQDGTLSYFGFDQELSKEFRLSDRRFFVKTSWAVHETFFHSTIGPSDVGGEVERPDVFSFRWKGKTDFGYRIRVPYLKRSEVSLQAIAGPQPLPVEILPRVYDYSQGLESFSELGTLLGVGATFRGIWSRRSSIDATLGTYAGYMGGGLALHVGDWAVSAGSWGIESSAAYHALGGRLWTAGTSVVF